MSTETENRAVVIEELPTKKMKIFGGIQLGLGTICVLLGLIITIIDASGKCRGRKNAFNCDQLDNTTSCYSYRLMDCLIFDIPQILLSAWFFVPGFIPLCMSQNKLYSFRCQKIGFMVCSILTAAGAVPGLLSFSIADTARRIQVERSIAVSILISIFAFAEGIVAIVSASFCCCCSVWGPPSYASELSAVVIHQDQGNITNVTTDARTQAQPSGIEINFQDKDYHY